MGKGNSRFLLPKGKNVGYTNVRIVNKESVTTEEYLLTHHWLLKGCSCWEWFVKRIEEVHEAVHFTKDAKDPLYHPYGAYRNKNEVPLRINYSFSSGTATEWANPDSTFDFIYTWNPPDFDVLSLLTFAIEG